MKRVLAIFLTLVMVIGVFAGCTTTDNNDSSKPADSSMSEESKGESSKEEETELFTYDGTSAPVVNSDKPIELTWLAATGIVNEENGIVMQTIQEIWGDKIKINWELKDWNDYGETVPPRLAAGNSLPDVAAVPGGFDANGKYWKSGIFQDISEAYEKYGFNLKRHYASIEDGGNGFTDLYEQLTKGTDGKMYYVTSTNCMGYGPQMMYNGKWLNALGLKAPTTVDEFYDMLVAFKNDDPNGNGEADEIPLALIQGWEYHFGYLFGIALCDNFMQNSAGDWEVIWTSDTYRDYLRFMNKLYKEGLLYAGWSSLSEDQLTTMIANDTVGYTMQWSYAVSYMFSTPYEEYDGTEGIWHLQIPIKAPNGNQFYSGVTSMGSAYGITRECDYRDLVFCLMDYCYSRQIVEIANLGIEGVDWKYDEDGKIVRDQDLLNDEEYQAKLCTVTRIIPYYQDIVAVDTEMPEWHAAEDTAILPYVKSAMVWAAANDADQEIYNQYYTDLNKYWNESMTQFIVGTMDVEAGWDAYLAQCDTMHQQEILNVFTNSQK